MIARLHLSEGGGVERRNANCRHPFFPDVGGACWSVINKIYPITGAATPGVKIEFGKTFIIMAFFKLLF